MEEEEEEKDVEKKLCSMSGKEKKLKKDIATSYISINR